LACTDKHPRTGYDPRNDGARCNDCALGPDSPLFSDTQRVWAPISAEIRPGKVIFVGSNPDDTDVEMGYPFRGDAGSELNRQLRSAGMKRGETSITTVIKCQPPGEQVGAFEAMTATLKRINKTLKKQGRESIEHPETCCRPVMLKDLEGFENIVLLGKVPLKAVMEKNYSIGGMKGSAEYFMLNGERRVKLCATYEPSHVHSSPGERPGVIADIQKFNRFFNDALLWQEPGVLFNPTVDEALDFMEQCAQQPRFFFDWETNSKDPATAVSRCVSFGFKHEPKMVKCWACADRHGPNPVKLQFLADIREAKAYTGVECVICKGEGRYETDFSTLLLTFTSISGQRFYSAAEYVRLVAGVNGLFAASRVKGGPIACGHNTGSYDKQHQERSPWRRYHFEADGVEFSFDAMMSYHEDSIIDIRYVNPEGSKALDAIGGRFEDAPLWKKLNQDAKAKVATGSRNDWQLGVYCCTDTTVDGRAWYKYRPIAIEHGSHNIIRPDLAEQLHQKIPYEVDLRAQYMCVGMHRVGIHVNQERRAFFEKILNTQAAYHLQEFNRLSGVILTDEDVKAGSDDSDPDSEEDAESQDINWELFKFDYDAEIETQNEKRNVNSGDKLRDLIYGEWGVTRPAILSMREFKTKTGMPSVGDAVLRAIAVDESTPRQRAEAIQHLRMAKRKRWKLGTMLKSFGRGVQGLHPSEWEGSEAARFGVTPAVGKEKGYIWPDGCVRSSWSSRTSVWRYDSSSPNMMNIGSRKGGIRQALSGETWKLLIRAAATGDQKTVDAAEMYIAQLVGRHLYTADKKGDFTGFGTSKMKAMFDFVPGFCGLGGDMDQLHLRIIANVYNIPVLLEAFQNGLDPHNYLAYSVFGKEFVNADGWGPEGFTLKKKPLGGTALQMREAMKTFRYSVIYGSSPETAWKVYVAVENDTGGLPYAGTGKKKIKAYHKAWMKAEPEWVTNFWEPCMAQYQSNALKNDGDGFLIEPLLGTRSGALEGGARSATANWTVLRLEAIIMRIFEARMMEEFPYRAITRERYRQLMRSGLRPTRSDLSTVNHGGFFGRYGCPDPGDHWVEGVNSNVHDFLSAQTLNESGTDYALAKTPWGKSRLEKVKELSNINIVGHPVTYSCDPGVGVGYHEV